jgi:hypothetical protein
MLLPLAAEVLIKISGENNDSGFGAFLQRYLHHDFEQTIINVSLGIVIGALALSIVFSLIYPAKEKENKELAEDFDAK